MNLFLENLRNDDPIGDNPFLLNLENPEPEGGVLASIQRAGGRLGRSIGGTLEATGDISTAGMVAGALGIDYESPVTSAGRTLAAASDEFLARPEIQTPSTQKLYDSSKGDFFDAEAWDPSILLTEEFYTEHAPEQLTYMVPFFAANAAGGMPAAVGANMVMEGGTAYRDARDKGSSHYEALRAAAIVAGAQVPLTVLTQGAASKIPGTGVARSLARGTTDVAGELVEETGQSIASQGAATTYDPNAEVNVGQALEEGAMAIPFAGGMQATSSALSRTVAAAVPAPKDNPFLKNIQEQQDRIHEAEQARIEQIGLSAEAGADVRSAMAQRVLDEMEDEQAAAEPVETPEAPAPAPTSASTVPTTRTTTEADGPSLADAVRALGGIFVDRDTAMQGEVARVVGESGSGADLFRQGILTRNRSGSDPDEVARQLEEQYPDIANNIRGTGDRLVGSDLLSALEDRENLFKRPLRDAGISENQEQEAVRQQSVVAKLDEEIAKATDPDITEALQARRQELQDGLDAPEERRSGDDEPLPFALRAVEEYQANLQIAGVKGTLKLVGAKKGIEQRLVRDGKRFGVDVVFVEGTSYGTPAMTTRDGKIVIRRGETNAGYKKLFAHETVHAIRRTDPELYGKLRAAIRKYSPGIAEEGQQEYLRRASRVSEVVAERIGQDPDTLEEEGIAQTVESFSHLLEDQAALETMAREDPSLFQQIKEWVEKKLDEFFATGARARIRRETEVGRALLNYQQMLTMAERRAGQIEGQDRRAAAAMPENQPKTEETEAGDQTVIDDDATKRKVAWTSGEQQNERYDLSKQVDLIQWGKRDGDKRVGIVVKSGANIRFTVDEQGKAAPDPEASFELDANISGKPIDEIVGKEMADKILAEESGNLEGKGLKIEGQGMKGFYDSMLPKAVGKYVKKLDKKHPGVGVMDVAGRQTTEADRHYEGPEHTSDEIRALAVQSNVASVQVREQMEEIAESVESGDSLVEAMRYFGSDTAAQALGGELVRDHVEGSQQLGIEVTDALRSSVMGGQAMFALEDEKKVTPAASSPKPQPVTFSDLVSSIDSQIAESVNPFDPTETKAQVVQRKMQDALAPLKRLEKEMLRQGVRITETSDPYLQEEFRRSRTRNRIEHDEKRFVDPIVKTTGAAEIDYDELSTFLIARHAEERNATIAERRGKPGAWSGMSDEVARHIQEAAAKGRQFRLKTNDQGRVTGQEVFSRPNKKRAAAFKRIGKLFDAMNNQRIDLMVRDGLLTAEAREAYRQWKHYAPLRTDMDEGRTKGTGQGLSIRGREHKSALGRQSLSDDPLAFAVDQMVSAHIRAEKNRVGLSLLALARQFPSSIWSVDRKLTKLQLGENGLVREVVYDPSGLQATDEERARTVSVKEKGVEHQILFAPEYAHIAKALKLMHADGVEGVTALVGSAVRFLAGMNTRWNPAFLPFNFLRDIGTGTLTVTGEHGIKMGASVARNAPKAIRAMWWTSNTGQRQRSKMERLGMRPNEEWLRYANEYRESGAPISFMNLDTVEDRAKRIRREVSSLQKGNIRQKSRTLALHAMDWIADSNDAVENGTRLAAYVAMRRQGRSVATSGSYAKNLTTQFERRGEFGHSINAWYMFSNAAIQGLARVGQAAQYPGVKVLMGSTVATAALMDIMNRALAGEDDDGENHYDKIEDHIKRRYMILMFPDGSGRRVQLPLPFVYGWFWTTGTMMGDMAHHPDHDIGKGVGEIATAFLDSMNPFGGAIDATTAFPTLLQPPVQHIANRNWKGKPITPKSHGQPIAPSELHWPDPNPTLKAVTKWLNEATGGNEVEPGFVSISPNVIEHYARFLTGGAGATGGRFLNLADKVVRGEPIQHHEIPVWRRLYAEPNPRYLKKRFREFEGELKTAQAKVRVAREKKDKNAYDAAREEHRAAFAVQELIKNTNRYIRNMETKIKTAKPDSSRKFEEQLHNHLARVNRAINRKRSELRSSTGGRR